MCEGNEAGLFVTAWMGIVELSTGKMVYANAGHNPPVIMKNGKIDYLRCPPGFVLAGMEGYDYREFELDLNKGDKLFLYTDGVTEAANGEHKLYGEERLINTLKSLEIQGGCADVIRQVRQDIDLFVGDEEQSDDLTMLTFDYTAKEKNRGLIERTFDASVDNLREVLAFVATSPITPIRAVRARRVSACILTKTASTSTPWTAVSRSIHWRTRIRTLRWHRKIGISAVWAS